MSIYIFLANLEDYVSIRHNQFWQTDILEKSGKMHCRLKHMYQLNVLSNWVSGYIIPPLALYFDFILSDILSLNLCIYCVTTAAFWFYIVRMGNCWKSPQPAYVKGWPTTTVRAGTLEPWSGTSWSGPRSWLLIPFKFHHCEQGN